jgi:hypothetical protein
MLRYSGYSEKGRTESTPRYSRYSENRSMLRYSRYSEFSLKKGRNLFVGLGGGPHSIGNRRLRRSARLLPQRACDPACTPLRLRSRSSHPSKHSPRPPTHPRPLPPLAFLPLTLPPRAILVCPQPVAEPGVRHRGGCTARLAARVTAQN